MPPPFPLPHTGAHLAFPAVGRRRLRPRRLEYLDLAQFSRGARPRLSVHRHGMPDDRPGARLELRPRTSMKVTTTADRPTGENGTIPAADAADRIREVLRRAEREAEASSGWVMRRQRTSPLETRDITRSRSWASPATTMTPPPR